MAIEVFNRYEHKYLINADQLETILAEVRLHMHYDPYNKDGRLYTIENIYYDTDEQSLIRRSLEKPPFKQKLRLRSYGEENRVYLEIKKKSDGIVNKRRTALRPEEADELLKNGSIALKKHMNKQIVYEIQYFLSIYDVYPKVYLAYDRMAFFDEENSDLRISFDFAIRSRECDLSFEHGDWGEPLFDEDICIMEVKTAYAKPLWLTKVMTGLKINRVSVSKYGTEYMKNRYKNTVLIGG